MAVKLPVLALPLLGLVLYAASRVVASDVPAFDPSCPSLCQCDHDDFVGTNVRCHYRNLTEVPSGLPTSTAWLFLNGNDITALPPSTFAHMPALQILDLQDNLIETLPEPSAKHEGAFHGLTRLETLRLSRNPLSNRLSASSFNGLSSLKTLKLLGTEWRCPVPEFCSTWTACVYTPRVTRSRQAAGRLGTRNQSPTQRAPTHPYPPTARSGDGHEIATVACSGCDPRRDREEQEAELRESAVKPSDDKGKKVFDDPGCTGEDDDGAHLLTDDGSTRPSLPRPPRTLRTLRRL